MDGCVSHREKNKSRAHGPGSHATTRKTSELPPPSDIGSATSPTSYTGQDAVAGAIPCWTCQNRQPGQEGSEHRPLKATHAALWPNNEWRVLATSKQRTPAAGIQPGLELCTSTPPPPPPRPQPSGLTAGAETKGYI